MHLNLRSILAIVVVLTAFWPGAAPAQETDPVYALLDLNIEDLMKIEVRTVSGASRFEQKETEAPANVTIITADDIKQYGYRTLGEILQRVTGIYTSYDRNYAYLGVRGFLRPGDYNSRFLLLVDGLRMNDNVFDSASIGTEFILDVDLIDRIETILGPSSSLYGSNAFFGIINVITRPAGSFAGVELSGEGRSFDTYKGRVSYGQRFKNGLELVLSGSTLQSHGRDLFFKEFASPVTNYGRADNRDSDRYSSFFGSVRFKDFTLQGATVSREKVIPTGSYDTVFNAPQNRTTDAASYLHLSYEKRFDEDRAFKASLSYNRSSYEGKYLLDYPPVTINRDSAEGRWWGGEARFTQRLFRTHKVTAGIEYRDNGRQEQQNFDEQPFALYLSDRRSSHVHAAYLQDEYTIVQNLILNAGVRYDHYTNFGGTTNPRIGLIYSPLTGTTIKALFGQAFRAPNAYELYYGDGNDTQKPNPDLRPERITTYELILDRYFRNYRFSLAGFYFRTKDLITLTTDPLDDLLVFRNIGRVESKGVETSLEGKWHKGITARFGYTIQSARDVDSGAMLSASPQHLVKFDTKVPVFGEKLSSGLELQYTSWQRTLDGSHAGGFLLCNLTFLSRNLVKGVELSGTLYNLLDKKYGNPASGEFHQRAIEQDGFSFRFKATARF